MLNKIIQKYKLPLMNILPGKKVVKSECMLNESIRGRKAVVVLNSKPIYGAVAKVSEVPSKEGQYPAKVMVTLVTENKRFVTFDATAKLASSEFKLISSWIYDKLKKLDDVTILKNLTKGACSDDKPTTKQTINTHISGVQSGDLVETVILSGIHKGIWIRAKVREIGRDIMNLLVLRPKKWKVASFALGVPKRFIRSVPWEEKGSYIVPIKFVMDNKIHYLSCNTLMTIKDLKKSVSELRCVGPNQLIFVNSGVPLLEMGPIPDDTIFCILCQKGGLTKSQMSLLFTMVKKNEQTASNLPQQREL